MEHLDQGSAYIFHWAGGSYDNWTQVKKMTASDGEYNDYFGRSVSISGDYAIVGAGYDDVGVYGQQGSAYIFYRNQGGTDHWEQVTQLTASDGEEDLYFGGSVAISGSYAVIGAYGDDIAPNAHQGSVYVFAKDQGGIDHWGPVKKIIAADGATSDEFGKSVSVSGSQILVGAWYGDGASTDSGAAYLATTSAGNSAPTATDATVTASEDAQYVFHTADFHFSDVDAGDTLQKVQITQLESAGYLKLNDVDVTLNQEILASEICCRPSYF